MSMRKNIYKVIMLSFALMVPIQIWADVPAPPANQTIGMDDGIFNNLEEVECRVCHSSGVPDRHHLLYGDPLPLGECSVNRNACLADADCDAAICSDTSPASACIIDTDCPYAGLGETCGEVCIGETSVPILDANQDGVDDTAYGCLNCHGQDDSGGVITFVVTRNCLVCHLQVPGEGSVHHLNDMAQGTDSPLGDPNKGDCTPCHGTLVDDIGDGHTIPTYDPSLVTPKPTEGDGEPFNSRGNGAGACDYCHDSGTDTVSDVQVSTNDDTHHNTGVFQSETGVLNNEACQWCHDVFLPDEYLIRKCEGCHGYESLHNIQADSDEPPDGVVVGGELPGYGHVGADDPGAGSDCWGCHGFSVTSAPGIGPVTPYINNSSQLVFAAGTDTQVTLTGTAFTNMMGTTQYTSDVTLTAADGSSVLLAPDSITQGELTVTILGTIAPGNYILRAVKDDAVSNPVTLSITPKVVITDVGCRQGIITITGSGFGDAPPDGAEEYINVEVDGVPVEITSWTDNEVKVSVSSCSGTVTVNALYGSETCDGIDCEMCYADCNRDGMVDLFDLTIMIVEFGRIECSDTNPCQADFNGDGSVDLFDLLILIIEYPAQNCCL